MHLSSLAHVAQDILVENIAPNFGLHVVDLVASTIVDCMELVGSVGLECPSCLRQEGLPRWFFL